MLRLVLAFLMLYHTNGFTSWIPPDKAIENLMQGNIRYLNETLQFSNRSHERRVETISDQKPFAAIICCSDSRGSPEIIFDQGIGDLFVVRVAGNVVGPVELASLEYSAVFLESSLIMVLGHQNCGAIKAVLDGNTKDIEPIADLVAPSIEHTKNRTGVHLENAIKENVFHFVQVLQENPVLADLIKKERLKIVGAYYDFNTGKVELLPIALKSNAQTAK